MPAARGGRSGEASTAVVQSRRIFWRRLNAVYDSQRASWYEDMGIMLVYATDGASGSDPFTHKVDTAGTPTHGHLPEDGNHGGQPTGLPDPAKLADGQTIDNGVAIANFVYMPGDLSQAAGFDPSAAGVE